MTEPAAICGGPTTGTDMTEDNTMATLTTPSTTVELFDHAVGLVRLMNIPPDTSVHIDVHERHSHTYLYVFPQTSEERRQVLGSPIFTGAVWQDHGIAGNNWLQTGLFGVEVAVFEPHRGVA